MKTRTEKDTMGPIEVPEDKYWGAQTQRSVGNFKIGEPGSMPKEIIRAFAIAWFNVNGNGGFGKFLSDILF